MRVKGSVGLSYFLDTPAWTFRLNALIACMALLGAWMVLSGWAIPTAQSEEGGVIATIFNVIGIIVGTMLGTVLYFAPSIIAYVRRTNVMAIFVLNLLLGWTLFGWVFALVWSLTDQRYQGVAPQPQDQPEK